MLATLLTPRFLVPAILVLIAIVLISAFARRR